jgi:hypothetical protein
MPSYCMLLLLCAFVAHQHFIDVCFCCSLVPPCCALLMFINVSLLCYMLLLFIDVSLCILNVHQCLLVVLHVILSIDVSLLCVLLVHQRLLVMCFWYSLGPPCCVLHSCCLSAPPCYVLLVFIAFFHCVQLLFIGTLLLALLLHVGTSLLCVIVAH